jgi:hypothetical protein
LLRRLFATLLIALAACGGDDPAPVVPEPVPLATFTDQVTHILPVGDRVYVGSRGWDPDPIVISWVPRTGGAPTVVVDSPTVDESESVAVRFAGADDTTVYWLEAAAEGAGRIRAIPIAGGPVRELATVTGCGQAVLDSTHVYFTHVDADEQPRISRVAKNGGETEELAAAGNRFGDVTGLIVDDQYLYWADGDRWTISKMAKTGGEPIVLAEGQSVRGPASFQPWISFTSDASSLYYVDRGLPVRLAKSGGPPVKVLQDFVNATHVAVDEDHVYFQYSFLDTALYAVPKSGEQAFLFSQQTGPMNCDLVLDASSLYWMRGDELVAADKPPAARRLPH